MDAEPSRPRRHRPVTEPVRERETLRYYPSLPVRRVSNAVTSRTPDLQISSSHDVILIALAQAAVFQTGADRAFISLFDTDSQYVVAEATRTSRLVPSSAGDECATNFWLCGTAMARRHAACEHSLLGDASHVLTRENLSRRQLPVTVVDDLANDARFCTRPLCQDGFFGRSYAGVPIRTRRGINIGVLSVNSQVGGKSWTSEHTERLRDISLAIMGHLESERLKLQHRRNARMNMGLGSFIEGEATLHGWEPEFDTAFTADDGSIEGALNARQQSLWQIRSKDDIGASVESHEDPAPASLGTSSILTEEEISSSRSFRSEPSANKHEGTTSDDAGPIDVLSRSCNIIREAVEVEGCLFLDATMGVYKVPAQKNQPYNCVESNSSTSGSDDTPDGPPIDQPEQHCEVLGYSTSNKSSVNGDVVSHFATALSQKFLSRLLRRYPKGKVFNFGADGLLQSSDTSESDEPYSRKSSVEAPDKPGSSGGELMMSRHTQCVKERPFAQQREGKALLKAFPGARCIAFTPVWDPRRDRWYAGGFIYTHNPARSFTEEDELGYLKAFGMLSMAEVLRVIDLQADKAKSDVLGSLSHELRSPLHGIILSAELLGDTSLSVFQGNAAHTIQLCSHTLLDTIDHLLDFSKINHFQAKRRRTQRAAVTGMNDLSLLGEKDLYCNARLDRLVEEVVESVYAGYTFQYLNMAGTRSTESATDHHHLNPTQPMVQIGDISTAGVAPSHSQGKVAVIMFFDAEQDWSFFVQVGAIRRIVMNLFGNALKYTSGGKVEVSLTQEFASIRRRKRERVVRFSVQDTGKGIGESFLRHGLFQPFCQEDTLTPGTGLGLSLVKQIVSQLQGEVSVKSQVGVGTTASVVLPLEKASNTAMADLQSSDDDQAFKGRVQDLRGLRIGLSLSRDNQKSETADWRNSVSAICRNWLTMDIVPSASSTATADILLWSYDALPNLPIGMAKLAKTPNVVICSNAFESSRASRMFEATNEGAILEFIAQPIGPYKLARALLLAYTRWMNVCGPFERSSPDSTTSRITDELKQKRNAEKAVKAATESLVHDARPGRLQRQSHLPIAAKLRTNSFANTQGPQVPDLHSDISSPESLDDANSVFSTTPLHPNSTSASGPEDSPASEPPDPLTRILIVDDNHINLKVLSTYMSKLSLEFDTAVNGREALDMFCAPQTPYSCVFMDISMPVMDGFEATRCIRSHENSENAGHVPIIGLSGLASEDARREGLGSGMDLLLTKPVKLKAVGQLLESLGLIEICPGQN